MKIKPLYMAPGPKPTPVAHKKHKKPPVTAKYIAPPPPGPKPLYMAPGPKTDKFD